jgi:hypothetical protein
MTGTRLNQICTEAGFEDGARKPRLDAMGLVQVLFFTTVVHYQEIPTDQTFGSSWRISYDCRCTLSPVRPSWVHAGDRRREMTTMAAEEPR